MYLARVKVASFDVGGAPFFLTVRSYIVFLAIGSGHSKAEDGLLFTHAFGQLPDGGIVIPTGADVQGEGVFAVGKILGYVVFRSVDIISRQLLANRKIAFFILGVKWEKEVVAHPFAIYIANEGAKADDGKGRALATQKLKSTANYKSTCYVIDGCGYPFCRTKDLGLLHKSSLKIYYLYFNLKSKECQ